MRHLIDNLNFNIVIVAVPPPSKIALATATIQHLNGTAEALLGFAREEIINKPLAMIVAQEYRTPLAQWLQSQLAQLQGDNKFECLLLNKQGRTIAALLTVSPLPDPSSETLEAALLIQDIADKQQQETLQIMHQAVEQSASAVVITDPKGHVEYANPNRLFCRRIAGTEFTHPAIRHDIERTLSRAVAFAAA